MRDSTLPFISLLILENPAKHLSTDDKRSSLRDNLQTNNEKVSQSERSLFLIHPESASQIVFQICDGLKNVLKMKSIIYKYTKKWPIPQTVYESTPLLQVICRFHENMINFITETAHNISRKFNVFSYNTRYLIKYVPHRLCWGPREGATSPIW